MGVAVGISLGVAGVGVSAADGGGATVGVGVGLPPPLGVSRQVCAPSGPGVCGAMVRGGGVAVAQRRPGDEEGEEDDEQRAGKRQQGDADAGGWSVGTGPGAVSMSQPSSSAALFLREYARK